MFLRATTRKKDGKEHRYWSIVENRRLGDGRVLQRHVLYLGEINASQEWAWRKSIEVFEDGAKAPRTLSLFPEDRCEGLVPDETVVRLRLSDLRLCRPRQWGACWLALWLWQELRLDEFWAKRLPRSRKGTRWDQVLFVLVAYRLLAPGSEWRLHREWYDRSALTYFECDPPEGDDAKRRFGHSRDRRSDCVQVVIALVVTPEGLPLAYEVLAGNTADNTTLRDFLARIEEQYGRARRIWAMDRGIPTEAVLKEMRESDPPVHYLVGTPKGRLSRFEKALLAQSWQEARPGVDVKLLPEDGELYVYAQSRDRVAKERAIRRRKLKRLWARLRQLSAMTLSREALLMKLGAARQKAPSAWRLVEVKLAKEEGTFRYRLRRDKLRQVRRREGRYLLRTNLTETDPAKLWHFYLQLVAVEEAFKNLKGDLAIRPIFHQREKRIEAHIFIAFLAYCLHVTLSRRL
ncbi:MAG: IS1634 family transposase, partial [Acidobacteria bacterium]|nr:IS1634 family transposase [Acidobacteriota bacterium]